MNRLDTILAYYDKLSNKLGPCHWWPAESKFEVAIGAILVQNTNWTNVEKAIENLKSENVLSIDGLNSLNDSTLQKLIRPSGFYKIKTIRLRNFLSYLKEQNISEISELNNYEDYSLRDDLLKIKGIGPETADSILLYALNKPFFVVDSYTKRIFNRHYLVHEDIDYHELQSFFMDVLEPDTTFFNEYHALLVKTAKTWCKKNNPDCNNCPLGSFLEN